jgi:5-methylthioadenosine/S-adenosylhomocysteine deaminase
MCKLCEQGTPQDHSQSPDASRRDFLKASTATAAAAAGATLLASTSAVADPHDPGPPEDSGRPGRRYVIRGGAVMTLDRDLGDFPQADVLIEGKTIVAVGPNLHAPGATPIDARGRIVMPGFVDTHHHSSRPRCAASSPTAC